jgi:diacylglycerol kinase family enzyme
LKLLIVFNPNAANGRSVRKLAAIKAKFESLGIRTEYKATAHPGHGSEIVACTDLAGFDGLIAAPAMLLPETWD